MASEKYQVYINGYLQDKVPRDNGLWKYTVVNDVYVSPVFDEWNTAMNVCVVLGIGRKTGESGTYELDQGVEIKAVK